MKPRRSLSSRAPFHTWVVAYDISDDRRRRLVAEILEGLGERVQYSVFECRLNEAELGRLHTRLSSVLDLSTDRVRWYPLCGPCHARVIGQGSGKIVEGEGFYLV